MGFLASDNVVECSATDLVGEYVGQTGPKVVSKFDEALGQVLFIDEAYRLGEGPYAREAIDEMVDCLTKERYKGKMLVILAGYEAEINLLLSVNPGLSSRFPEEIMFHHLTPDLCVDLLHKKLQRSEKLTLELEPVSDLKPLAEDLFLRLSKLSGWANGRDIETVGSRIIAHVLKSPRALNGRLSLKWSDVLLQLDRMYTERERRATEVREPSYESQLRKMQQTRDCLVQPNKGPHANKSAIADQTVPQIIEAPVMQEEHKPSQNVDTRDPDVSDATWQQLQADRALREKEEAAHEEAIKNAQATQAALAQQATDDAAKEEALEKQAAIDDEARRRWEEMRQKAVEAKRRADEEALRLKKLMEERQRAQQQEQKAQERLRQMGVCPAGFRWIKQSGGYRCGGGSHFVTDTQLGI